VSRDGLAWTTVRTTIGYTASAGTPVVVDVGSTPLRFVELRATRLAPASAGLYYAAVAEIELSTASEPAGTVVASWTAPTDDGPSGGATRYDLRVAPCPLNTATAPTAATPAPSAPGTPERARVTGLASGLTCFAIRSLDAAGNASAFSTAVSISMP